MKNFPSPSQILSYHITPDSHKQRGEMTMGGAANGYQLLGILQQLAEGWVVGGDGMNVCPASLAATGQTGSRVL